MNDEQFSLIVEYLREISSRLDEIERAVSDVSHKTPEYSAYTLKDVVDGLWEIEKAIRDQ